MNDKMEGKESVDVYIFIYIYIILNIINSIACTEINNVLYLHCT